jgi:hypothetical protein
MTRRSILPLAAVIVLTTAAIPAGAGGYVGLEVSNHGVSLGFGASNWGIWGSSWNSGGASIGFSATLAGYGDWVHVNGLGQVWRPWVSTGWQPYTHGRWMWTSQGWTWIAYEPWGWVPHHYGNWAFSTIGWVWTPGYAYHPGNVVWVSTGVHLGWYPYAPVGWSHASRGYHHGWRDGYASGHWNGYSQGYADGWRDARYATWVPRSQVTAENIAHHRVGHEAATYAVARSRVTVMAGSPTRNQVEGYAGRPVPEARIIERKATVDGREVRMVRPEGQEQTVRRHGASTVERALNPKARRMVATADATPVRRQNTAQVKTDRPTRSGSGRTETRRSIADERHESTSRSVARSPGTVSTPSVPSRRTRSLSESSPQHRTASASTGSQRSAGRAPSTTGTARQAERPQVSTNRTRSATHAAPPQKRESTGRRPSAREEPETKTSPDLQRRTRREKIEPTKKEKPKRGRPRT